jgi:hypothetical protein
MPITITSPGQIAAAISSASRLHAQEAVAQVLASVPIDDTSLARDASVLASRIAALLTTARATTLDARARLGLEAEQALLTYRLAEFEQAPFEAGVYRVALEELRQLAHPVEDQVLDDTVCQLADDHLTEVLAELTQLAASRNPFGKGERIRAAASSLRAALDALALGAEIRLSQALSASVAADLQALLTAWIAAIQTSQVSISTVLGQAQARLAAELTQGRTRAGHRFSITPDPTVLRAYAGRSNPALAEDGRPGRAFWSSFGRWLVTRPEGPWLASELGEEETRTALSAYAAWLAADVFPDNLTLATLYRGAGVDLPVGEWERLAQPRLRASDGAWPEQASAIVEAPAEVAAADAWDTRRVRVSADPNRVTIVRVAHGYTLADLLRGDAATPENDLDQIAAAAGTPVMAAAIREYLPKVLGDTADHDTPRPPAQPGPMDSAQSEEASSDAVVNGRADTGIRSR